MPHFEKFEKPIQETIDSRISCRTYQDRRLTSDDKARLLAFCDSIQDGLKDERITFRLVEHDKESLKGMKLTYYGLFKNAQSFIVGITERSDSMHLSFGYAFEHVVLRATELGLGTCWFGAFNPELVRNVVVSENQMIPAICVVGYPAERKTLKEKIARYAIRASKRKDWRDIFFHENFSVPLNRQTAGKYTVPLECLRLAPSSGNTQPWRVVRHGDSNMFHFFKEIVSDRYEKMHFHDIDIGIAICHFELGCMERKINGVWVDRAHNIEDIPEKTTYVMSWEETK